MNQKCNGMHVWSHKSNFLHILYLISSYPRVVKHFQLLEFFPTLISELKLLFLTSNELLTSKDHFQLRMGLSKSNISKFTIAPTHSMLL